jgi:ssRNA-specific RNase YbeY (16S rRNA maturation enzyme)
MDVTEFLNAAGTAYGKVIEENRVKENILIKNHVGELEKEVKFLKNELAKYKNKDQLEKRILPKIKEEKIIPKKKPEIKVVEIDKEEIKKLQLQILKLEKICEVLEKSKKTKKLEDAKD